MTLLEATIAVGLCATLAAGIAPVLIGVSQTADATRLRATATAAAVERLEQLRALRWTTVADGGIDVLVSDTTSSLDGPTLASDGTGLGESPADSLLVDRAGWVDYLDAQGRWVGRRADAPASRLVRRWRIRRLPSSPDEACVIEVLVASRATEQQVGPRTDTSPRYGDVWLSGMRVRERVP